MKTVSAGPHSFAVTHYEGRYAALNNRCPHQGGPLGEGSIEKGMLRCPWHGYDYCPLDGSSPFGDSVPTFPIEIRDDGVYVGVEPERAARPHGHRRDGRDDGQLGRAPRLRHGRALQPRPRRRAAPPGGGRQAHLHRHPPRGRRRVRRLGLRQAHRPAGGVPDDRRPGRDEPAHRAVGRERRPLAGARADRPGRHAGARPGRLPGGRPLGRVRQGRPLDPAGARDLQARRADDARVQARDPPAGPGPPDLPRRGADAARRRQRRLGPRGPDHAARDQPAGVGARAGARAARDRQAAGDHRRSRRALSPRSGDRAGRADSARR